MNNSHKPHLESHQTTRGIDVSVLEPVNARVLCRRLTKNTQEPMSSGIYYPESYNKNQFLYQNADVVYEVVKTPKTLKHTRLSRWETENEILSGDMVWVERRSALNSPDVYDEEGNEYRLIEYYKLIVAKRKDKVIPLNGYCLMSNVVTQKMGMRGKNIIQEPRVIYALACVDYIGKPNKSYNTGASDEGVDLKKGMVVVLAQVNKNNASMDRNYLEESMFARFDGKKRYFFEQRRSVLGYIENDD